MLTTQQSDIMMQRIAATMGYDDVVIGKGENSLKAAKRCLDMSPELQKVRINMHN